MGMRVRISSAALQQLRAESGAAPECEVCGLLLGDGCVITEARACANVADDPARGFEIDPAALVAAHRSARAGGPALIGCYHSHPNGRPEPSPRDAAAAAPDGMIWLIVAGDTIGAWRAGETGDVGDRFTAVALDAMEPACEVAPARPESALRQDVGGEPSP